VCLLWLAWAAFIWSLLVEVVEVVAGIRLPQPKAMAPARGLAALLVAAVAGGVLATAAQAAPTLIHPAVATGHSTTVQAPAGADRDSGTTQAPPTVAARPETPATDRPTTRLAAGQITLVAAGQSFECKVQHGDTLSEIAKEWLGDANRWPEIWALNRGTHFAQVGGTFTSPHLIYPGWVLELPEDAIPPATAQPAPPTAPPQAETPSTPEPPAPAQPTAEPAAPETTAAQPGPTTSRPTDDGVTEPVPATPATTSTPPGPTSRGSIPAIPPRAHRHRPAAPPAVRRTRRPARRPMRAVPTASPWGPEAGWTSASPPRSPPPRPWSGRCVGAATSHAHPAPTPEPATLTSRRCRRSSPRCGAACGDE